jgi:hypothetical protein
MSEVEKIDSSSNAIRYQAGRPSTPSAEPLPVGARGQQGGTVRVHADGRVEFEGVKRSTDIQPSSNPLDSARDAKFHMPVSRNAIKPETLLTIGGIQAPASSWEESGHLVRDANGQYSMGQPQTQQQSQPQQQQNVEPAARLSEAAEGHMANALSTLGATTMNGLATAIMESKADVEAQMVTAAASRMGLEPSQMRETVERVKQEFVSQAQSAVSSVVPVEEWDGFVEWAHANRPNEVREAMHAQVNSARLGPIKTLAQEYAMSGDAFTDGELLATDTSGTGYRIFESDGKVIADIPRKGQMLARAAIKAGLLPLVVTARTRR